jgi:ribulose kinase
MNFFWWPCNRFNKFLEDVVAEEESDQDEIISMGYSSGNSCESDMIVIPMDKEFHKMTQDEKDNHTFILWRKLTKKLKGSVRVI